MTQFKWVKQDIAEIKRIGGTKKRTAKLLNQYKRQGWCDADTWSLDATLARLILPRLKRYQKTTMSSATQKSEKEWNDILDKMIKGFEFIASPEYYGYNADEKKMVEETLQLFAEYFTDLWS